MVRLIAYQNLYGPIGPSRLDVVAARLGMDVAAPHMKKGQRPKLKDHLVQWSRNARPRKSGRELLAAVRGIQAGYDRRDRREGGA
ncbi:phage tail assembly protein T [Streptomyces zaomyceticus]|uniref:phage tail assembly protein T n=1 Tax=Streptomyces zaomyceticus TaxID=68286 RepID=UPI00343CBCA4